MQGPAPNDDAAPSTSANEETDAREAGTQTNPHYFIRSPGKVTLDEILRGIQRIQVTMEHMLTDFEQRISRLEGIVLKMRNAWIHHRTCHLEGLEYDDEQGD
ncbi:Chaperone protein DnaJ [Varanus komodoensis]|nr:Chaperone protein DnaJ [Varanus komodoensis]